MSGQSLRNNAFVAFASVAAIVATLATADATTARPAATSNVDRSARVERVSDVRTQVGKSVVLSVGPGISDFRASAAERLLEKQGCPTTITRDGRLFGTSVMAEVDGQSEFYDTIEDAMAGASMDCAPSNGKKG